MYTIRAWSGRPKEQPIEATLTDIEMRQMYTDSIVSGVIASQQM